MQLDSAGRAVNINPRCGLISEDHVTSGSYEKLFKSIVFLGIAKKDRRHKAKASVVVKMKKRINSICVSALLVSVSSSSKANKYWESTRVVWPR